MEKRVSFFHKNNKERGQSIVIPNIPKIVDERARMKLLSDYDKYEPELFKHHIGTPETTRTIGLKFAPAEFDRRLPSQNEPTAAEREYEARRRNRQTHSHTHLPFTSSHVGHTPKRGAADLQLAVPAASAEAARESIAPCSTGASTAVPLPEHVLPQTPNQERSKRSLVPMSPDSLALPPGKEAKSLETPSKSTEAATSKKKVSPKQSQPQPQSPREEPQKSVPVPVVKKETKRPASPVQPLRPFPPAKFGGAANVGSVASIQTKHEDVLTSERCAQLLRVLLNPPPEYSESFKLDLRNIDLKWMHGNRYPASLVSLLSWNPAESHGSVPSLNSPRSVIVMLQNGVVVNDLVPKTSLHDDPLLPTDPELRQLVKRMRSDCQRRQHEALLQSLRDKYADLCRNVNLPELLKAFHGEKKRETFVEIPTSLKKDHERRQRALLNERARLEKQVNFAKDVHERQLIAEERQRRVEEEAIAKLEAKKAEERLAQEKAAERLALHRQKMEEMEAFYQKELQQRLARAEEKHARRVKAQEQNVKHRREVQQRLAEERQLRFERVAKQQEQQKLIIQQKHEVKEEKLQRLRDEQERRREELHNSMLERAAKSLELRELARKRAAVHEENVRKAAEEQQRKVEERLQRFQESCKEERAKRALKEEEKRVRMQAAVNAAAQKVNVYKEEIIEKQMRHEKLFDELQRQREAEILARQEHEREEMEAKSFAVERNKRMTEFGKLETVRQLLSKREAAVALEKERMLLREETRKAREALRAERHALKEEIARQTEIMQ